MGQRNAHAMQCSASEGEEILTQATTWMNLEGMVLSEKSQTQKNKYCMSHSYEAPGIVTLVEAESRLESSGGCRGGGWEGVV